MMVSTTMLVNLLCLSLVTGQTQIESSNETTLENSTSSQLIPTEGTPVAYEFIVKLIFGMENTKLPDFLLDIIFDTPNNITTEEVLKLYSLKSVNMTESIEILDKLKYVSSAVMSIKGFENFLKDFDVNFKNFYDTTMNNWNVSGKPLRDFLSNLNIKTDEFSAAFTYGDPDPFEVFKQGNFSEASLKNSLDNLNKTADELFIACRDAIIVEVIKTPLHDFLNILKKYNFDRVEGKNLWDILEMDVENAENITVFANLLDELRLTLENVTLLGILTSNKVAINKNIRDNIEKMEISKLFAQSLYDNTTVELKEDKPYYDNIITFTPVTNNFTTFAEIDTTSKNLQNCEFLTLENGTIVSQNVESVSNKQSTLEIEAVNITDIIQGSPLLCQNKIYGLAKEIDDGKIVFDTFAIHSGVLRIAISPLLLFSCFIIYLKM